MNASNASADLVRIQSDRITALEDEGERLRLELSATHDMAATLEADVLRLRAERDALRADAERWRYLRARRWIEIAAGSVDFSIAGPDASAEAQAFRDSEIDAALAARGKDE